MYNYFKKYKIIFYFILLDLALNILQAIFTPISVDECYLLKAYPNFFEWTYLENSPILILSSKLGALWVGQNNLGYRIISIIFFTLFKILLWNLLKPYKDNKNQSVFVQLFFSIPLLSVISIYNNEIIYVVFFITYFLYLIKHQEINFKIGIQFVICITALIYLQSIGVFFLILLLITNSHLFKIKFFQKIFIVSLLLTFPYLFFLFKHFTQLQYNFNTTINFFSLNHNWKIIGIKFIVLVGPFIFLPFLFKLENKTAHINKKFNNTLFVLLISSFVYIFITIIINNFQPISFILIALPVLIIFFQKKYWFRINPLYKKINYVFIIIIILYIRLIEPNYIYYATSTPQHTIQESDFILRLFKEYNCDFVAIKEPQLASTLSFLSNKQVGVVSDLESKFNDYKLNIGLKQFHNKPVCLISLYDKRLMEWDTIFYKRKNFLYKTIDSFYYWGEYSIFNVQLLEKKDTIIDISYNVSLPSYASIEYFDKMKTALYIQNIKNQILDVKPLKINFIKPISNNLYLITASFSNNFNVNIQSGLKAGFSILQNDQLFYLNSILYELQKIGL